MPNDTPLVSAKVEIEGGKLSSLLSTIKDVFAKSKRVERIFYERGRPLTVEAYVENLEPADPILAFATPYQSIRQHAAILGVIELEGSEVLLRIAEGIDKLADRGFLLTAMIINPRSTFPLNPHGLDIGRIFRVPVIPDEEVFATDLFLAASKIGPKITDIEASIIVRC